MNITKLRGTVDYYNVDGYKYQKIVDTLSSVCNRFGFTLVVTPIIEATELFVRSVGDSTDVVRKEMYTFLDKGERSISLRPEGTASITRMFVEQKLYAASPVNKFYYYGPMFRYERPSAGRLRQLSQFGVELYGTSSALMDADMINMSQMMLKELGIKDSIVHINCLASNDSRKRYVEALRKHFEPVIDEMCEDCKARYATNPLRILDCKVDTNNPYLVNAPKISDYLTEAEVAYFKDVQRYLDELNVKYIVDDKLVRGLDYYTGVVFELINNDEASPIYNQALGGGGRYNGLSEELGGPATEAIGFAFGIDRLMLMLNDDLDYLNCDCCVIALGKEAKANAVRLVNYLRSHKINCEFDYNDSSLKSQFKLSDRVNAKKILIMGLDEINQDIIQLKDKVNNTQTTINIKELNKVFNIEGETEYAYKK